MADQPVWRCLPGKDPELFYNSYWFVKRSHATRRVKAALEEAALMCMAMARHMDERGDTMATKVADSLAQRIRELKVRAAATNDAKDHRG